MARQSGISCSFCGKSPREVEAMISASSVFICDGCIMKCLSIICEREEMKELRRSGSDDAMPHAAQLKYDARTLLRNMIAGEWGPGMAREAVRARLERVQLGKQEITAQLEKLGERLGTLRIEEAELLSMQK